MNIISRSLGGLVLAGGLLLSGCGDDGGIELSAEDQTFADALSAEWTAQDAFPGVETDCLAEGFTQGIGGASVAAEYGVTADNVGGEAFATNPLSEDDAVGAANAMYACDDFKSTFVGEILGIEDLPADDLSCMVDAISDEPLRGLFASTFMGDNAGPLEERYENTFEAEFDAGIESCGISG